MFLPNRTDYLDALKAAIVLRYGCDATHREAAHVFETLGNTQVVWEGYVEVFDLIDHEGSDTCYAWCRSKVDGMVINTLLKSSFVDSPQKAVQSALFADMETPHPPDLFVTQPPEKILPLDRFRDDKTIPLFPPGEPPKERL